MAGKRLILDGWFSISTGEESNIDDRARERFGLEGDDPERRQDYLRKNFVDKEGSITRKGWDVLSEDVGRLERNALEWLRKILEGATDEGHGDFGDLIGGFWFDARNPKQLEIVLAGVEHGISESNFDLDPHAWKGVSDFGISLLDVGINLNVEKEVLDKANAREAWERTTHERRD